VIRIEQLTKIYPGRGADHLALDAVDLSIDKGEIFGIIGRSGAGKSTLIRCLNRLETPSSGRVLVDGQDLSTLSARELPRMRQRLGMIFQHFNLLHAKTVAQNVSFPLRLAGRHDRDAIDRRVDALLERVGLSAYRDSYPARLSGGQKQRVGIARALANAPSVLLSDEATSALDPQTTLSILQLLQDINRELGLTIVLITHEMSVIRNLCDRVAVLDHGRVVETGRVADIFLHPQHAVTRSLLAESGTPDEGALIQLRQRATGPLLRLTFVGDTTYQPLLSRATEETGLRFNILQGSVGRIKETPYGQLLVEAVGAHVEIGPALAFFTRWNVHHEVVA